ncbi:MAG TPA: hypothetical protein PKY35_08565 [Candidatus Hydrogenedentes bacterium]|nr:hypothetical protein [Candidatus Hydrogenedentota bacterium]HOL77068.1 hypothetical protein [Candidatus Hydrogenedentota bacterium]HPO87136.1 hypothetical protein [Candidatus Hydrogenedentota bacterium]
MRDLNRKVKETDAAITNFWKVAAVPILDKYGAGIYRAGASQVAVGSDGGFDSAQSS